MLGNSICKKWGIFLFLILFYSFTYAQKTVSGTVRSANNEPTSGATVTVTGTQVATQTDVSGNFTINVPPGKNSLTITYVGVLLKLLMLLINLLSTSHWPPQIRLWSKLLWLDMVLKDGVM